MSTPFDRLLSAAAPEGRADALVQFVREGRTISPSGPGEITVGALIQAMDESPDQRDRFLEALSALLAEADGTALFGDVGIPSDRGFLAELGDRISSRLIPSPRRPRPRRDRPAPLRLGPTSRRSAASRSPTPTGSSGSSMRGLRRRRPPPGARRFRRRFPAAPGADPGPGLSRELRVRSSPGRSRPRRSTGSSGRATPSSTPGSAAATFARRSRPSTRTRGSAARSPGSSIAISRTPASASTSSSASRSSTVASPARH
ncbi:MAG: hypothetical protein IPF66_16555 [Holophagales bacterium]|nr:hypothetical protein [Holophagales bacterium]